MKLAEHKEIKKKKPKFLRQDTHKKKRIKKNWRKPRGIDSKMRLQLKGKSPIVKPGYGSPKIFKGLNPEGLKEIIVENVKDLGKIEEGCIALISSKVGKRKMIDIFEQAKKDNIQIANCTEDKINNIQKELKERKDKKKKIKETEIKKEAEKKEKETPEIKKEDKEKAETEKKEKEKILTKKGAQQ